MAYVKKGREMARRGTMYLFFNEKEIINANFQSAAHRKKINDDWMRRYRLNHHEKSIYIHVIYD